MLLFDDPFVEQISEVDPGSAWRNLGKILPDLAHRDRRRFLDTLLGSQRVSHDSSSRTPEQIPECRPEAEPAVEFPDFAKAHDVVVDDEGIGRRIIYGSQSWETPRVNDNEIVDLREICHRPFLQVDVDLEMREVADTEHHLQRRPYGSCALVCVQETFVKVAPDLEAAACRDDR